MAFFLHTPNTSYFSHVLHSSLTLVPLQFFLIPDSLWSLRAYFYSHLMYILFNLSLHILHVLHLFIFHSILIVVFFWHSCIFLLVTLPYHRRRRDFFLNFTSFICNMSFMSTVFVHSSFLLLVHSFTSPNVLLAALISNTLSTHVSSVVLRLTPLKK